MNADRAVPLYWETVDNPLSPFIKGENFCAGLRFVPFSHYARSASWIDIIPVIVYSVQLLVKHATLFN